MHNLCSTLTISKLMNRCFIQSCLKSIPKTTIRLFNYENYVQTRRKDVKDSMMVVMPVNGIKGDKEMKVCLKIFDVICKISFKIVNHCSSFRIRHFLVLRLELIIIISYTTIIKNILYSENTTSFYVKKIH